MSLTVTVERHVVPGTQGDMKKLLRELRAGATRSGGLISGQSLVDARSPFILLTVSTWASIAVWESWEGNPERGEIIGQINQLLQGKPVIRLWLDEHDAPAGAD